MIGTLTPKKYQDTKLILTEISWEKMEAIEQSFTNIGGVIFLWLDGILEIMTVIPEHEETKKTIALLLETCMKKNVSNAMIEVDLH